MVFSFFKKLPEKMAAKPAAVFRSGERSAGAPGGDHASGARNPEDASDASGDARNTNDSATDFNDFDFSNSLRDMQVDTEIGPIDADVEQVATLYADGHDAAARALLEDAVRVHRYGPGERLWLMLFDFYLLTGQKAAFEALASDYAQCFGQCSPGWRAGARHAVVARTVGNVTFKGALAGNNDAAFRALQQAIEKNPVLRLDLSKVDEIDAAGCGRLLFQLQKARKARREIEVLGGDKLRRQLESRVRAGRAVDGDCWLLLLDLYQAQGEQQCFEDLAIDYAVSFEISPPSWEERRVAAPAPSPAPAAEERAMVEAYVAQGDIKGARFADLAAYIEVHNPVFIDCANLARIDFISAGALLNVLSSARRAGKHIIFRHPNHLVAELFGIVGLGAVADIVPADN
ncbi:MAG: STAS domain-containing protein [Betaproteobacteria bacterium]|nr:STAS domain-containing protein [Betaproteobacteria bacterium]